MFILFEIYKIKTNKTQVNHDVDKKWLWLDGINSLILKS